MDSIGGYFELELKNLGFVFHDNAIAVNSGRNALEYILLLKKYKKLYLPYYTCDVTLQPIKKLNLNYEFYYLDNDFLPILKKIKDNEALLFVNYFGLMNNNIKYLKYKYKNLIIDNAQAFYSNPVDEVLTFYSPRKFFGLPDGGFVYSNTKRKLILEIDKSSNRISHLINRIEDGAEAGYKFFQQNDNKLNNLPLRRMSKLTDKLLRNIDFEAVRRKRNENFEILHIKLKNDNELTPIIEKTIVNGPMVYPFLAKGNVKLRDKLISEKIFVPKYWPNVIKWLGDKKYWENYLFENLIALPIDQRYYYKEMNKILKII
jgi:hypothetical protein